MAELVLMEPRNAIKSESFSFQVNDLQIEVKEIEVKEEQEEQNHVKRGSKLFFRDEELFLSCEWNQCGQEFREWEEFQQHVEEHLAEITEGMYQDYACLWKGCGFEESDMREMARHLHFHSYHTKLKCHGKNILYSDQGNSTMNWSDIKTPCTLLPKTLPRLKRYRCKWFGCKSQDIDWLQPMDFFDHVYAHKHVRGDGLFECMWPECDKTKKQQTFASKFKEHMRSHTNEKRTACPNCGSMFANRVKFFDHCRRQELQDVTFPCGECGKILASERIFRDHARVHAKLYNCHLCSQTCPSPSTLKQHIIYKHTSERPYSCQMLHCNYTCKTQADLKVHDRKHNNAILQCHSCDYSCKARNTLKIHINELHSSVAHTYACHLCEFKANRGHKLSDHLGTHNVYFSKVLSRFIFKQNFQTGFYQLREDMRELPSEAPIGKPVEPDEFVDYDAITNFIALDVKKELIENNMDVELNNEKDSKLEMKDNPLDAETNSNETMKSESRGKINCDVESREIRSQINTILKEQIETIQDKSLGIFQKCKPCGKVSKSKQSLMAHIEVHLEGVSYECLNCNSQYKTKNSLNIHLFTSKECHSKSGRKYKINMSSDGLKLNPLSQEKKYKGPTKLTSKVDDLFDYSLFMGSVSQ